MTDQQIASTDRIQVRAELKAPRAAGIAGLAFAVLFTAALIALRQQPLVGATDAEILDWFAAGNAGFVVVAGLYLAPFSGSRSCGSSRSSVTGSGLERTDFSEPSSSAAGCCSSP